MHQKLHIKRKPPEPNRIRCAPILTNRIGALLFAKFVKPCSTCATPYRPRPPPHPPFSKFARKEDKPIKYYVSFHSLAGGTYKASSGCDGVTDDAMRDLRRVVKSSQKAMAKGNRLDTVSIELVTEDGWEQTDVAVIVEDRDEYERLHKAIATLLPEQQQLIHAIYFQGISQREIARVEGVSDAAISDRLKRIYKKLKIILQ